MRNKSSWKSLLYGLFYKNFVKLHWLPRAEQIHSFIKEISLNKSFTRLVDFGCGDGSLAEIATIHNLNYLGIDLNPKLIEVAKSKNKSNINAEFLIGTEKDLYKILDKDDLICLNGVAHHLNDEHFAAIVSLASTCQGLLILDHEKVTLTQNPLSFLLQKLDFGKYVRSNEMYSVLDDLTLTKKNIFRICFFGITFWTHFIAYYEPAK